LAQLYHILYLKALEFHLNEFLVPYINFCKIKII
jgi:hypothetical protein